ncbi:hypothetical protein Bbelb_162570 [Branchiostoma belcheri]|nr:hypothetical protein Bbelb_162570 [Branchiostoma belcheri]
MAGTRHGVSRQKEAVLEQRSTFQERSSPLRTVVAFSQNGRRLSERSSPFLRTVVALIRDGNLHGVVAAGPEVKRQGRRCSGRAGTGAGDVHRERRKSTGYGTNYRPRALRSPIAGELIPRGVGRPDASPAACVGRRTESSRARVRALGSPSPTHGLPRCASLRRQTLVAEGTASLLRRLRRAFCRRERVKPSGYSTLARSGGFARLMRSGVRGGHKDTVALARCRVYALTVNAFTPHAFTVHAFTVHAFTVHAFTPHAFTPHAFTVHAFTVHAFTVHAFTVPVFTVHAFTPHAFTPHAFTPHAFTVHAFTVHAFTVHAFTVHAFTVHDTVDSSDTLYSVLQTPYLSITV